MPRTVSLDLEFAAVDAAAVLQALAKLYVPTRPGTAPATELQSLFATLSCAPSRAECVTLEFAPDPALRQFAAEHAGIVPRSEGRVAVGCWWTSVRSAGDRLCLSMTSATASIAELVHDSASLRGAFLAIANAAPVQVTVVDDEGESRPLR